MTTAHPANVGFGAPAAVFLDGVLVRTSLAGAL